MQAGERTDSAAFKLCMTFAAFQISSFGLNDIYYTEHINTHTHCKERINVYVNYFIASEPPHHRARAVINLRLNVNSNGGKPEQQIGLGKLGS